ncbi:unnamed protein product [Thelazia callipaeda]|uniref:RNase_Zc3h12a domain-containing protein n=1 Tax=Thelazia callipaeda TaxID=103827 RepID=A0A0N5D558_THECL|nr:unnamed protein product [Thelazia callipaeda]
MRDSETEERISKIRRSPLSVICDRSADGVKERNPDYLLRPIFINGVEVGFAYATCDGIKKKLAVRGITISLWYFISRGHQAQALLPLCFKNFPDKSDRWDELMALYRMNLIEFTPGFGNDKYMEVNRIMARRTREHGGCMVARSQMHQIVERDPLLDKTVEMKLLMPSFNGKDLMFPIDGPLGRKGPSLTDTLKCTTDDPEWTRCGLQQLTLNDQRIWLKNLSDITLDSEWMIIASKINRYQLTKAAFVPSILEPNEAMHLELHPFQTNQGDNRGTYEMRHRAQQNDFHGRQSLIVHCILRFDNYCSRSYIRPNAQGSRVLSEEQRRYRTADRNFPDSNTYFVPSYRRNSRTLHEVILHYLE